ncbi:MAG: hypothetical protein QW400_03150 [Candidatus Diapherotrites archaeon]
MDLLDTIFGRSDFVTNLWVVLCIVYTIWIFGWFKKQLGSAKIAAILTTLVVYLTFVQYPELILIPIVLFLIQTFFSGMFEKIPAGSKKPEFLKD